MISLEKSIKTCKVNVGNATRQQSDRFLNHNKALCYTWTGLDNVGREINNDTFMTKSAGCNLTSDRIVVENDQRPKYFNYVNLDAKGISQPSKMGGDYGLNLSKNMNCHSYANI